MGNRHALEIALQPVVTPEADQVIVPRRDIDAGRERPVQPDALLSLIDDAGRPCDDIQIRQDAEKKENP